MAKAETKKIKVIVEGEDDLPATPIAAVQLFRQGGEAGSGAETQPVQESPKTVSVDEGLSATLDDLDFDD